MIITNANPKDNLGEFILFAFPVRKRKRNEISGFSFIIMSVRMVTLLQLLPDAALGTFEGRCRWQIWLRLANPLQTGQPTRSSGLFGHVRKTQKQPATLFHYSHWIQKNDPGTDS